MTALRGFIPRLEVAFKDHDGDAAGEGGEPARDRPAHGRRFEHRYNSVKRFVRGLKSRDPERFDVLESLPGEAQVDFGLGAVTLKANGKYRRPYLFVMTLKYSGKSFRVQSLTSFSIT